MLLWTEAVRDADMVQEGWGRIFNIDFWTGKGENDSASSASLEIWIRLGSGPGMAVAVGLWSSRRSC